MGLPQKRLTDEAHRDAMRRRFDGCSQTRASAADDQHIMLVGLALLQSYQNSLISLMMPIDRRRMYKSVNPTEKRLSQNQSM